jgi:hypothetical protein
MKNLSVLEIAQSLGALSRKWLRRDFVFRKKALKRLTTASGFTPAQADALLDSIFTELTFPKLKKLLRAEIGNPLYLDTFQKDRVSGACRRAHGPGLITHIFSANVPNPAIMSFVLGMLIKSHNAGKVSGRDGGFLDIYLESLKKHDAALAKGQNIIPDSKLKASLAKSGAVVVYGSDETVAYFKKIAPAKAAFSGYGHRVSFAVVLKEALNAKGASGLCRALADDIWMLDQRGCLSPYAIHLEEGGEIRPDAFAALLAKELRKRERRWTLIYQRAWKGLALSGGQRTVWVRPFRGLERIYKEIAPYREYLQCVALEGSEARRREAAERFTALGLNRITRAGRMQKPPVTWMHDGRPNFSDWLRWTDLEP